MINVCKYMVNINLDFESFRHRRFESVIENSNLSNAIITSKMSKVILMVTVIMVSLGFTGCNKDPKTELFAQSYDELTSYYIDINSLAKGMDISVSDLVKIRYGLMESNPELAEELNKLLSDYREYNNKGVKKILEKKHEFTMHVSSHKNTSADLLQSYRKTVFSRNENFQSKMPKIAGDEIVNNVEKFIDKEYAWYRFPINGWNLLIDGKEKTYNKYSSKISSILSESKINDIVVKRFNGYELLIEAECATLFNKDLNLQPLKGISHDNESSLTSKEILNNFVKRSTIDLTDLLLTLVEEVGISLLIWLIFSIIINKVINHFEKQAIGYIQGAGWWNVAFFAFDMWNMWEKDEEVRKWKRIKGWTQGIIFAIFLVVTWIYVIKPSGQLENEIMSNCETNVTEYIENLNLPLQSYFNNIIESEL